MDRDFTFYDTFIPARIAQLRMKKGVSAREMSLAIGQNESYINQIENKNKLPSMQGFLFICEYLEIAPQDFFDTENVNPQIVNQVMEKLKKLDDDTLVHIYHLINKMI